MRYRHTLSAAVLAVTLAGCAPDAWRPDQPFDIFLGQVADKCGNFNLGGFPMWQVVKNDAYFQDQASRLFNRTISADNFRLGIDSFYPGTTNVQGLIDCIIAQMPAAKDAPPPLTLPPSLR